MTKSVEVVRYCVFGNFAQIDYSPANVSRLFSAFEEDGFVPNVIQVFQIEQPSNQTSTLMRPQLLNPEIHCTISIMPDRIDMQCTHDLPIDDVVSYFSKLQKDFECGFNRLALNKTTVMKNLSAESIRRLIEELGAPHNEDETGKTIEFSSHVVLRDISQALQETLNIVRNIEGMPSKVDSEVRFRSIKVDTDINTLAENQGIRFQREKIHAFFEEAEGIDKKVITEFEERICCNE